MGSPFRIVLLAGATSLGVFGACSDSASTGENTDIWLPGGDTSSSSGATRPPVTSSASVGSGGNGGAAGMGGSSSMGGAGGTQDAGDGG